MTGTESLILVWAIILAFMGTLVALWILAPDFMIDLLEAKYRLENRFFGWKIDFIELHWYRFFQKHKHRHWRKTERFGGGLAGDGWTETYCRLCGVQKEIEWNKP